jgi:D-threo-aldose 1-dehydrogenase
MHIHERDDHFDKACNEVYKALAKLRAEDTISAMSASMNQWQTLARIVDHGDFDCFLLAGRYFDVAS